MKIERLYLKNFTGIQVGLGLKEIEIDFTKTDKNIIILSGANGSGKSVIINSLHPFMSNYDDERKDEVRPGEKGIKEIRIRNKDDVYDITHFYETGKNKSFLKKNGEELNENGGVRTFIATIEKELDVTPQFFKVGRITSRNNNFIDLTSSDRKRFINQFLPDIDPYLKANTTLQRKVSDMKKLVNHLSVEMDKLSPPEETNSKRVILESRLEDINNHITSLQRSIIEKETTVKNNEESIADRAKYVTQMESTEKEINKLEKNISDILEKYKALSSLDINGLENALEKYRKEHSEADRELAVSKERERSTKENIDRLNERLTNIKNELSTINTDGRSAGDIQKLIHENELKKVGLEKDLAIISAKINMDAIEEFPVEMLHAAKGRFDSIKEGVIDLKGDYDRDHFERVLEDIQLPKGSRNMKYRLSAHELRRENVERRRKLLGTLEAQAKTAETLKLRPSNCRIDDCGFIKQALSFKDAPQKLRDLQEELRKADVEAAENASEIEAMKSAIELNDKLNTLYNSFKNNKIARYVETKDFVNTLPNFISLFMLDNPGIINVFNSIDNLIEYHEIQKNIDGIPLERLNETLEIAVNNEKSVNSKKVEIEAEEKILKESTDNLNEIGENIKKYSATVSVNETRIDIVSKLLDLYNTKQDKEKEYTSLKDQFSSAAETMKQIAIDKTEIEELKKDESTTSKNLKEVEKELQELSIVESQYNNYHGQKSNLEENLSKLENIRRAVDPIRGIPVYLVKGYLDSIKNDTNNLLDIAYGGQFRIDDFVLNEREFLIPIRKNGVTTVNDISASSQGETSLTKMSLSLALFNRAMGDYNVLTLDEVDATLDTDNRSRFIQILNDQIETLGLEQVFVISHNRNFYSVEAGLVALKNHDFDFNDELMMENKDLIFEFQS